MAGAKRKYIEAAYELLARDGLEGVSIRKVADHLGCSSAALYRHFPDVNMLTAVASIRFLRDYVDDARVLSKVELNPLELNLQLWECLAYYSFRNADIFENLFFGAASGAVYAEAVEEYCAQYPEDHAGLKGFMVDMLSDATIAERDLVLLERAVECGMLAGDGARHLSALDSYLYRGVLAELRSGQPGEQRVREVTREFMQMLIRSYTAQLEEGYSILVVSPDFEADGPARGAGERGSFRVRVVPLSGSKAGKGNRKATA